MRRVSVIGIGAGDPDQVTLQAVAALRTVDVFFVVVKTRENQELVELRHEILRRHAGDRPHRIVEISDPERERRPADYAATVAAWRAARAQLWGAALRDELADGAHGAFLVWGDPSFYDSTIDVLADVRATLDFEQEVVPGIGSVQLLAARHGIVLNRVGRSIEITPARRLADALAGGAADVVVMLDAGTAFADVDEAGIEIYWGAYLGTPDELLIAGPLADVAGEIARVRAEAKARKGWMFDTYLLRRTA